MRRALTVILTALGAGLCCQSPALVRTARTLPEGGSDVSLSLNLTRISLGETTVEGVRLPLRDFNLPNPIPDISYDYGVTDDVELGGRLSMGSGLLEARMKLRVLQAAKDTLNVALGPAAGYRVLGLVNGPVLTLPLIVTYDLSPGMAISGGPVASFASYSVPDSLNFGDDPYLGGDTLYAGGGIGLEFRPAYGIHVMPAVEVQRSVVRHGEIDDLPVIDMIFFGITFGWGSRHAARPTRAPDGLEAPPELPEPEPPQPMRSDQASKSMPSKSPAAPMSPSASATPPTSGSSTPPAPARSVAP